MHMQGEPRTMQQQPSYGDVVAEVRDFLARRVAAARAAGIADERLVLDPGFGFGKTWNTTWPCCATCRKPQWTACPSSPACRARPCWAPSPLQAVANGWRPT